MKIVDMESFEKTSKLRKIIEAKDKKHQKTCLRGWVQESSFRLMDTLYPITMW